MTRYTILQDLKAMIGPGPQAVDSQLITWINSAYSQVIDAILQANPDYFVKSATSSSVTGQQEYALPSDFMKLIVCNLQLGGTWVRVTPFGSGDIRYIPTVADTGDQGYSTSSPRYYILGNNIGFMPIPDETTSNNIKLWYAYTPAELTSDSSEPAIPKQLHNYLTIGAYSFYLDLQREHVAAERMRTRFDAYIERGVQNIIERTTDESKSVQISDTSAYEDTNSVYTY